MQIRHLYRVTLKKDLKPTVKFHYDGSDDNEELVPNSKTLYVAAKGFDDLAELVNGMNTEISSFTDQGTVIFLDKEGAI